MPLSTTVSLCSRISCCISQAASAQGHPPGILCHAPQHDCVVLFKNFMLHQSSSIIPGTSYTCQHLTHTSDYAAKRVNCAFMPCFACRMQLVSSGMSTPHMHGSMQEQVNSQAWAAEQGIEVCSHYSCSSVLVSMSTCKLTSSAICQHEGSIA